MKAITLYQPWASLVSIGAKTIETRSCSTRYRGPLAIHTAKKAVPVDDPYYRSVLASAGLAYDELPQGVIVATCSLVDCRVITSANCPCYPEYAFGDFKPGWYAWKLTDIKRIHDPVPSRGHRGLWDLKIIK